MGSWDSSGGQLRAGPVSEDTGFPSVCHLPSTMINSRILYSGEMHTCSQAWPRVQMGNCMPNHPFRHPLICFPHANMGFLQMDLIYLLLPHFI